MRLLKVQAAVNFIGKSTQILYEKKTKRNKWKQNTEKKAKYSVLNQNENYAGMKPKTCAVGVRNATGILVPFSLSPKIGHQQQ